ncbi:MAG: hypothetical protein ACHQTF_08195 [Gemmatimonadales bacterium]
MAMLIDSIAVASAMEPESRAVPEPLWAAAVRVVVNDVQRATAAARTNARRFGWGVAALVLTGSSMMVERELGEPRHG